jgi:hypothetical protein
VSVKIYLSGGIKKDCNDKKICWTIKDMDIIRKIIKDAIFLDPQKNPERPDPFAAFGCDLHDIKEADFIFVDARQKRGIGIGAEMAIAKVLEKPVITISPKNSHYFRETLDHFGEQIKDWKHPFIVGLSDAVVEDVSEAARWIADFVKNPRPIKDRSVFQEAVDHFLKKREERA